MIHIPLNLCAQQSRANNRRKRNGAKTGVSYCFSLELALVTASKVRAWNSRYLIFKQEERNKGGCVQPAVLTESLNLSCANFITESSLLLVGYGLH